MRVVVRIWLLVALGSSGIGSAAGAITQGIDPEAQLPYWELRRGDIALRLIQRLPEQTRGFFLARGFSAAGADRVAEACVFQTILKNVAAPAERGVPASRVHYDLREWRVIADGSSRRMQTRERWRARWRDGRESQAARIAFEWALFPTEQTYRPGDYNWGMSIFGLRPGASFDLKLVWHERGQTRSAVIRQMRCAAENSNVEGL